MVCVPWSVAWPTVEGAYPRPLQRKYEGLRAPVDVDAAVRDFMAYNTAAAEAAEAAEAEAAVTRRQRRRQRKEAAARAAVVVAGLKIGDLNQT